MINTWLTQSHLFLQHETLATCIGSPRGFMDTHVLSTLDLLGTILGAKNWYIRQSPFFLGAHIS